MKRQFLLAFATFFLLIGRAWAVPAGLELMLLVDVSGSVNASEYNLQKTGYVNAFKNPAIQGQIASTANGVLVSYAEWSSSNQQLLLVNWTLLTDAASANTFADAIAATTRAFNNLTAPGAAINWGVPLFNNGYEGSRLVMDISGDGTGESSTATAAASAFAAGIRVNGLAIGSLTIQNWYQNNIVGPGGGQLFSAEDFGDFDEAISRKIGTEISNPVPEPGTMLLLGSGLTGLALRRRRSSS